MGFLPGNIYDKFAPWILPIFQNIALITNNPAYLSPNATLSDLAKINISIAPPGYMRGQTLSKVIFIIDEAQNLTSHQIKTIITRAGEGVKLIFTGDLTQIDRSGLTASSSGLAYAIRRMKGSPMVGIVNLSAVIRSPLVEYANKVL
jgi:PhoH-like ATPase